MCSFWLGYIVYLSECMCTAGLDELTEAQRAVLEPAYGYSRPLLEDDGVTVSSPEREGQEAPVRSAHDTRDY